MGSNRTYFPYQAPRFEIEEYWKLSLKKAEEANIGEVVVATEDQEIIDDVKELIFIQFDFIEHDILSYTCDILFENIMHTYFTHIMPRRSYKTCSGHCFIIWGIQKCVQKSCWALVW